MPFHSLFTNVRTGNKKFSFISKKQKSIDEHGFGKQKSHRNYDFHLSITQG